MKNLKNKKKHLYILVLPVTIFLICCIYHLQYQREISILSCSNMTGKNYYKEDITVSLNKLWVDSSKHSIKRDILDRYESNNFQEIRFSTDFENTKHTTLYVSVYLNDYAWKHNQELFEFTYKK